MASASCCEGLEVTQALKNEVNMSIYVYVVKGLVHRTIYVLSIYVLIDDILVSVPCYSNCDNTGINYEKKKKKPSLESAEPFIPTDIGLRCSRGQRLNYAITVF